MPQRDYWLDLFTGTTWQEFLKAGCEVSGFRESRQRMVEQIKLGDYLLCYLTGVSRFIGILEVVKKPFKDSKPIWKQEAFPCRVGVKVVAALTPETAVPIVEMKDQLSIFKSDKGASYWTGFVRASPAKWKRSDGEAVLQAVLNAEANPVVRSVDKRKLARLPQALKSKLGPVTVPEPEEEEQLQDTKEPTAHTEIQWLLAKLGNDMGLDVWVARNDRNREINGNRFTELPRLKTELQLNFEEAANRTIERIDVLWLKANSIVAAFEIECTTSIYSGLLRMSDLLSMLPNLKIPLFIVAPDERRAKVFTEVNRPTFSRLPVPMHQTCRYIALSTLREQVSKVKDYVRHLKPEILDDFAEVCEAEEV
jgi:EVE domain